MYERMFGDALLADRMRGSLGKMPLVEAERARRRQRRVMASRWCPQALATFLIALATRIAPTVAVPNRSTPSPAQ
jgi:hypothetical protein